MLDNSRGRERKQKELDWNNGWSGGRYKIDTVIFDIGNVLAGFSWDNHIQKWLGNRRRQVIDEVNEAIWGNGLWNEFDRNVLSYDEIIDSFVKAKPDREREIRMICDVKLIGDCMTKLDYATPWVQSVKAVGCRVLYLSNYMYFMMTAAPDVFEFLPFMDGGVFSCCVQLIKPDREIYARICRNYNLTPSRCVFIDDSMPNVQAARDFGMNAIHFENYTQARAELSSLIA